MNVAWVNLILFFILFRFVSFLFIFISIHCVLSISEDAVLNFLVPVLDERDASLQLTRLWNKWKLRRW